MFNETLAHNDVNLIKLYQQFLIIQKIYKNMFLYEKTPRYLKNDYQFFDTLKQKIVKLEEIVTY